MILLAPGDVLQVVTVVTISTDVYATWTGAFGRKRFASTFTGGVTTEAVPTPARGDTNAVTSLHVRNAHASSAQTVTVQVYDGTTAVPLLKLSLAAGESLHYEGERWWVLDSQGRTKEAPATAGSVVSTLNTVVLATDVTNNNASANTIADVTGLSFAVTAGETYWFWFVIPYTAAATTTGSRWAINGPASPTLLNCVSRYTITATTETLNYVTAYDTPAGANSDSLTAGNVATLVGHIKPSSNGTVIARFASEVSASAIVAKAGALLQWMRVL